MVRPGAARSGWLGAIGNATPAPGAESPTNCLEVCCGMTWTGLRNPPPLPIHFRMSIDDAAVRAGGFARERFKVRRRSWRRRLWWAFPIVAILPVAVELPIALLTHPSHQGFWIGMGIGAGTAAALVLFDSPPAHIERWRSGADGEKSTARALRPLLRRGWKLFNDINTGHGNIDHVLVGPAGVFMLESKRLAGQVRVEASKLSVRWHEDPGDGYQNESIARRARGAAYDLHSRIDTSGCSHWVQAIVVLWADFEQRSIESDKVAWVRGDQLANVLARRPTKYSGRELRELIWRTNDAVTALRQATPAPADDHTMRPTQ
jgi:Nuclease-related domain